jgi:methylated-DNA-protein-cysteine methyltransferase related protein
MRKPSSARREASTGTGRNARVHAVVRRIPRGRVATYGQVATLAGIPGHARQVGYALHDLPSGTSVPWHRVVNARGEISLRATPGYDVEQRVRLEIEGVRFDRRGRIALDEFRWEPRQRLAPRR